LEGRRWSAASENSRKCSRMQKYLGDMEHRPSRSTSHIERSPDFDDSREAARKLLTPSVSHKSAFRLNPNERLPIADQSILPPLPGTARDSPKSGGRSSPGPKQGKFRNLFRRVTGNREEADADDEDVFSPKGIVRRTPPPAVIVGSPQGSPRNGPSTNASNNASPSRTSPCLPGLPGSPVISYNATSGTCANSAAVTAGTAGTAGTGQKAEMGRRPDDPEALAFMMSQFPEFCAEKYTIVRQMYKSAASHVHLAVVNSDNSTVVLKFLKAHTKVRHEIRALKAVAGIPGTVQLTSVQKTPNGEEIVLLMVEVKAKSRHYVPENVDGVKRYMRQLLEVLTRLHSIGIIHRDIKESNALMADRVVVIDFGLSVLSDTCIGQAGTKGYIAPELQVKAGVGTNKVDTFSAGVVFSQLIFGFHLRGLRNAHSLRNCHTKEQTIAWAKQRFPTWDKVDRVDNLYDEAVMDLIRQMLNFDPAERPSARQCLQHRCFLSEWQPSSISESCSSSPG